MSPRLTVTYHVRAEAADIEARAQAIAVEQSVEMPLAGIDDPAVLADIVGQVEQIDDCGDGSFSVRIGLAVATIGRDAGQLLNMAFGNTSLQDDVVLADIAVSDSLVATFGGPRHGIAGIRARLNQPNRALTGSALKPQGLPPEGLADLAERLALGGLDFVKDDHGLAEQDAAPFAARVPACAAAVARAVQSTGHPTLYVPSLSGSLDQMRTQLRLARDEGLECVMLAPMIAGFATVQALVQAFPEMIVFAHPSLGGAARIAPDLLFGGLFRLLGADAVIFPNHGGRFGYTPATCQRLAARARRPDKGMRPALPVPAGGMTLDRTAEILDFYGRNTMLLIGGSLLTAGAELTAATQAFVRAVADHPFS